MRLRRGVEDVAQQPADLANRARGSAGRAAALRGPAAFRPRGRRRAPGSSARRSRAGRNTAPPADRSCVSISFSVPRCSSPICGSTRSTTSPSSSSTSRSTPCAAGCCGPKLMVKFLTSASAITTLLLVARQHVVGTLPRVTDSRTGGIPAPASPAHRRRACALRRSGPRHSRWSGNPCAADSRQNRSR